MESEFYVNETGTMIHKKNVSQAKSDLFANESGTMVIKEDAEDNKDLLEE